MSRRGEQNKKKKAAAASSTRIDDWMEHRGVVACYGGGSWYQWSSSGRKPSVDIVWLLLKRTSRRTRQTAKTLLLLLLSPPSLRTSNCFIHSSAPDDCTRDVIIVEHGTHARHQKEIKTSCAVFMLIISFRCSLNPNANSFFFFIQQLPCWEVGWWYGGEMMELLQFSSSSPSTVLFRRIVAIAASFLFLSPTLLSCVKTP